ncbi:MAG: alpha/beta fold hydrolase [Polyangiales bacterium]
MESTVRNPWLPLGKPRDAASVRLFCFPHAGGSSAVFQSWRARLPQSIDVCPVELPGRARRFSEAPVEKLSDLIEPIASALEPHVGGSFALFGHSMGALIAFEVARSLRDRGRLPSHLFVAGMGGPREKSTDRDLRSLDDADFAEAVREINGTPSEVLADQELSAIFLRILRADFTAVETHTCQASLPLGCPITAFGGSSDPWVNLRSLSSWKEETSARFEAVMFEGDHFFVRPAEGPLLAKITKELLRDRSRP